MNEGEKKKYPAEVRKGHLASEPSLPGGKSWEDTTVEEFARANFKALDRRLSRLGIDIRKAKVLDAGSGSGVFSKYLREVHGVDVTGVDARPRGYTEHTVAARIEALAFKNGSFDVITASSLFDPRVYEQHEKEMVDEISRVLRQGGVFVSFGTIPSYRGQLELIEDEGYMATFRKP